MPEITGDWLRAVGFVPIGQRWHYELNEHTSLWLQRASDGMAWLPTIADVAGVVCLRRRLVSRANVLTLIPALGGRLHHLVEV